MVATAAHLTDHVLPSLPVRQWVLAVPKRLRYFLERDADLQGTALHLFLRAVESCLRAHSPGSGPAARFGAVAFIHRFRSSINAHLHFHCVVIDGVFDSATTGGVIFTAANAVDARRLGVLRDLEVAPARVGHTSDFDDLAADEIAVVARVSVGLQIAAPPREEGGGMLTRTIPVNW